MAPPPAPSASGKSMHLPWHQAEAYWLCVMPADAGVAHSLPKVMAASGIEEHEGFFGIAAPRQWAGAWRQLCDALTHARLLEHVTVAVIPGAEAPQASQVRAAAMASAQVEALAANLWLGDALIDNRVMCYLQPVMTNAGKVFGYESFARVRETDGRLREGGDIVQASRALCIEYAIDRQLHIQAIRTFASSAFPGSLFVNFFPGFIQRPEVYLEGLGETARAFGIISKHIVLDFTHCETPHDIQHLKRVTEYCRTRGYAIALDDLETVQQTRLLLEAVKPDYVKLETRLSQTLGNSNQRETVRQIVELCRGSGAVVIAEGVETEEAFRILKELGVDLFQGYHFAPPMPVENVSQHIQASA